MDEALQDDRMMDDVRKTFSPVAFTYLASEAVKLKKQIGELPDEFSKNPYAHAMFDAFMTRGKYEIAMKVAAIYYSRKFLIELSIQFNS